MADDSTKKKSGLGIALLKKLMVSSTADGGGGSQPGGAGSNALKRLSLSTGDSGGGKSKWGDVTKRKASLMVLGELGMSPIEKLRSWY